MPQLRQNIITGEWVVIAPERAKRPDEYVKATTVKRQSKIDCPFCVTSDEYQKRYKKYDSKNVYIAANKFPVFIEDGENISARSYKIEDNFYRARPSVGGHDIVVVKDHDNDLMKFSRQTWLEILQAFKKRYEYYASKGANYTMPIYNHGPEAGASIEHPHAQIFASNIIPNIPRMELHKSQEYWEKNGECVFCKLIEHEKQNKIRIIFENKDFIAFTFYAARFPFEIWILPKKHSDRFEKDSIYKSLAETLQKVFSKLDNSLNNPPLNLFLHSLSNTVKSASYYHWHIEIAPRLANYGGFELGAGTIIDVVSPEKAAEFLNKH